MLAFYYLSVTTNLIMGLILVCSPKDTEKYNVKYPFLKDPTFLLVLLIFSGITAVFKLLNPIEGSIPLIGDILPAISGIVGCALFFDRWIQAAESSLSLPPFLLRLTDFEQAIGCFCLTVGIAHLLLPQILFL